MSNVVYGTTIMMARFDTILCPRKKFNLDFSCIINARPLSQVGRGPWWEDRCIFPRAQPQTIRQTGRPAQCAKLNSGSHKGVTFIPFRITLRREMTMLATGGDAKRRASLETGKEQ
jgi:hypothetical protein